jgi:ABC-type protease/lipase transport system fused ATPase/permease subunit
MLAWCDDVLVMNAGAVHAFGRREQVLARLPAYRSPPRVANDVTSPGAARIQEATR